MLDFFVLKFQLFLIILMRLLGMMVIAPVFSSGITPMRFKLILALVAAIMMYPMITQVGITIPDNMITFGLVLAGEFIIGLSIGFIIALIFVIFQLSGQFFSLQMGYGISQVFDPLAQVQISLIGQFQALFGTLVFIAIGGPKLMIFSIYQSYFKVPTFNMMDMAGPLAETVLSVFIDMFEIALKLGFPVIGTVMVVTVCLGLLAKFAPQMNIMMLGFPIYIVVGFITLLAIMPFFITQGADALRYYFRLIIYQLY